MNLKTNRLLNKNKLITKQKITPGALPVRKWSNIELRKFSHVFKGDILNVSGWEDKDKEGGYYKDYFPKSNSYTISNFSPGHKSTNNKNEIHLDLEKPISKHLKEKFDVVFSHTNIEHIFEIFLSFKNHCDMSRDIVIIVAPFIQQQHENEEYKDYWRFTPSSLRELFRRNGLKTIYEAFTDKQNTVNYLLFVGSKHPDKWKNKMPKFKKLFQIAKWAG